MRPETLRTAVEVMLELAREAGNLAVERVAQATIMTKTDGADFKDPFAARAKNLFSSVDLECQQLILRRLAACFPEHGLTAEEEGVDQPSAEGPGGPRWVIDPIDGTFYHLLNNPDFYAFERRRDILAKFDHEDLKKQFGVSLALIEGQRMLAGAVNFPRLSLLYHAVDTEGVWCNGLPLVLPSSAPDTLVLSRSLPELLRRRVQNPQISLNSVTSFRKILKGEVSAYVVPQPYFYDIAGGIALLLGAGGVVLQLDGTPLDFQVRRCPQILIAARDLKIFHRVRDLLT